MFLSFPRILRLALLFLFPALFSPALADDKPAPVYATIQAGHSAMWYDRTRSGEGWMLEILPDDGAVVYWFTFDDEGNPRWLTGSGHVVRGESGDEIRFDQLIAVHGPRFGPDYNPADVVREDKGSATFRFHDCATGEITFDAYERQGRFPLTRLTRTMGATGCRPIHGTPGEPVQPYAGQSGSWYDPAFSGQGFSLGWMPNGDAALVWFTFDAHGNPYWLTATGKQEEEGIVFPELISVRGGRFADAFDNEDVIRTAWGRLEMSLECDTGEAIYKPTEEGFAEGQFDLRRLTRLESPACPWVKPKLTDLYDIAVTELPVEWMPAWVTPIEILLPPGFIRNTGETISVHGVADDGGVVGTSIGYSDFEPYYVPVRLPPEASHWVDVIDYQLDPAVLAPSVTTAGIFVSAAGDEVLLNKITGTADDHLMVEPVFVHDGEVTPMPDPLWPGDNRAHGASKDLSFVVGSGLVPDESGGWVEKSWKWDAQRGQVAMRTSEDVPFARPLCVSNDGAMVIGVQERGVPAESITQAVSWAHEGRPRVLESEQEGRLINPRACSADAGIVFGEFAVLSWTWPGDEWTVVDSWPGFWKRNGENGYLGALAATQEDAVGWPFGINDVSSDGTLAVGWYQSSEMAESPSSGSVSASGGLIWTQDTGHVLVSDLLAELEHSLDWPTMHVAAISPNGEYVLLTTGEFQADPPRLSPKVHSALLRLTRK